MNLRIPFFLWCAHVDYAKKMTCSFFFWLIIWTCPFWGIADSGSLNRSGYLFLTSFMVMTYNIAMASTCNTIVAVLLVERLLLHSYPTETLWLQIDQLFWNHIFTLVGKSTSCPGELIDCKFRIISTKDIHKLRNNH